VSVQHAEERQTKKLASSKEFGMNKKNGFMSESLANEQKPVASAEEKESFKLVFLQCSEHLQRVLDSANMLGDGSTKITIMIMKDYLGLRSQPTSGRKHKRTKRIVEFSELQKKCRCRDLLLLPTGITLKGMMTWMLVVTMKVRLMHE
jgi:hypothetical protein